MHGKCVKLRLHCHTNNARRYDVLRQNSDSIHEIAYLACVRRSTPWPGHYQPGNRVICATAQPTQTGGSKQIHYNHCINTTKNRTLIHATRARTGWSTPRPGRFNNGKDTRYPLYRKLVGHQSWFRWVRNISPPRRFNP
jgi:hypothetical protein